MTPDPFTDLLGTDRGTDSRPVTEEENMRAARWAAEQASALSRKPMWAFVPADGAQLASMALLCLAHAAFSQGDTPSLSDLPTFLNDPDARARVMRDVVDSALLEGIFAPGGEYDRDGRHGSEAVGMLLLALA